MLSHYLLLSLLFLEQQSLQQRYFNQCCHCCTLSRREYVNTPQYRHDMTVFLLHEVLHQSYHEQYDMEHFGGQCARKCDEAHSRWGPFCFCFFCPCPSGSLSPPLWGLPTPSGPTSFRFILSYLKLRE